MGGGKGNPTVISTAAIVMAGKTLTSAKSIVPKSIFFILLSPILIVKKRAYSAASDLVGLCLV
jgi:hypothetical protein